jgi:prepilin-type N-terminal cleavage/methylation domain-containing protein
MTRLRDNAGFTLPELVIAMTLGMVVLIAAYTLLDRSFRASTEIADRQDTLQRGRQAMQTITRQIRSQVCLGTASRPLVAAAPDSVSFYTDLSGGGISPQPNAQLRTITYDPSARTITESVYDGTGTYPNLTFPSQPTRTAVLLEKVDRIPDAGYSGGFRPIFDYHRFADNPLNGATARLTSTPLSEADRARTVKVTVQFIANPLRQATQVSERRTTHFRNEVYVRSADPNNPTGGPRCV